MSVTLLFQLILSFQDDCQINFKKKDTGQDKFNGWKILRETQSKNLFVIFPGIFLLLRDNESLLLTSSHVNPRRLHN